jgi:hypothetical protein
VPLNKNFKLFLYGSCHDLEGNQENDKVDKIKACKVIKNIELKISEE